MEIKERLGLKDSRNIRFNVINPLLAEKLLKLQFPEKPDVKNQRYITTEQGKIFLENSDKGMLL